MRAQRIPWIIANLTLGLWLINRPSLAGNITLIDDEGNAQTFQVARICDVVTIFKSIITASVALVGLVVFIMLLWGGFQLLTAGPNDQKIAQARQTITWGIIGMVVLLSSYFVLLLITQFTGVDITQLTVPWVRGHANFAPPADCL